MLSIVIPYYKITFFEATLQSLANQTNKNFKVYIGNDASPENPDGLINKFEGKFGFIYRLFDNNLGKTSLVSHWNRCLALTDKEDWTMILGDDDVLSDNFVAQFYKNSKLISDENINVVRFSTYLINEKNQSISDLYLHPILEKSTDFYFRNSRSSLSEYVFKINKINLIKFKDFPLAWHSDILAVLEISDFGNVFSINDAFVKVRISNQSISGQSNNLKLKEIATFQFYEYLIKYKINYFTISQRSFLFDKLNLRFNNNKKNIYIFYKINLIYIKIKNWIGLIKFYKSIVKSLLLKF
jgi:hypothetical protein